MYYTGPTIFKQRMRTIYKKVLENYLPPFFNPGSVGVEVSLDTILGKGRFLKEMPRGKVKVCTIELEEHEDWNIYPILGVAGKKEYNQRINDLVRSLNEENKVETSRQLRDLCGLRALRKLADALEPKYKGRYVSEPNFIPFGYARDEEFIKSSFGVDLSVNSPTFKDTERKVISFPPSTVIEAFIPGILIGENIPAEIKTSTQYDTFIASVLAQKGGNYDTYLQNSQLMLVGRMSHGLVHYILTTKSVPYQQYRKLCQDSLVLSRGELAQKESEALTLFQKTKDLDLDIVVEAAARSVAPSAPCRNFEPKRIPRLEIADAAIKSNTFILEKIPAIISHAWATERNAVDLLREVA